MSNFCAKLYLSSQTLESVARRSCGGAGSLANQSARNCDALHRHLRVQ
jgi:hypothetical protein